MIQKGTVLFPTSSDWHQLYYYDKPYAYWNEGLGLWILYKEYNDYVSECAPDDCISAYNYDEVINAIKTFSFYDNLDRESCCKAFVQRSLDYV